jgi:hypothetical protein
MNNEFGERATILSFVKKDSGKTIFVCLFVYFMAEYKFMKVIVEYGKTTRKKS